MARKTEDERDPADVAAPLAEQDERAAQALLGQVRVKGVARPAPEARPGVSPASAPSSDSSIQSSSGGAASWT
ncbi:MAG TPA: hypothetical protein VMN82_03740 [Thermoanaerobaculia bacterium]|nr:hypothetical protein [Thermoanaerobaculia bacterium]